MLTAETNCMLESITVSSWLMALIGQDRLADEFLTYYLTRWQCSVFKLLVVVGFFYCPSPVWGSEPPYYFYGQATDPDSFWNYCSLREQSVGIFFSRATKVACAPCPRKVKNPCNFWGFCVVFVLFFFLVLPFFPTWALILKELEQLPSLSYIFPFKRGWSGKEGLHWTSDILSSPFATPKSHYSNLKNSRGKTPAWALFPALNERFLQREEIV